MNRLISLFALLIGLFTWNSSLAQDTTSTETDTTEQDGATGFRILGTPTLDSIPSLGLKLGVNRHTIYGSDVGENVEFRGGGHLGLYLLYPLSDRLAVKPELLYSREGYRERDMNDEDQLFFLDLNYFSIPIMVRFHLGNGFFVEGGPSANLLLGASHLDKVEPERGSISLSNGFQRFDETNSTEADDQYNSFDVGVELGGGYVIDEGWTIGVRGDLGFMGLMSDPPEGSSNFSSVGGRISIAKTF